MTCFIILAVTPDNVNILTLSDVVIFAQKRHVNLRFWVKTRVAGPVRQRRKKIGFLMPLNIPEALRRLSQGNKMGVQKCAVLRPNITWFCPARRVSGEENFGFLISQNVLEALRRPLQNIIKVENPRKKIDIFEAHLKKRKIRGSFAEIGATFWHFWGFHFFNFENIAPQGKIFKKKCT